MILELNIHCFSYQKRLTWMLSSILQQKGCVPEIVVSIAYLPGNGNPQTIEVIDFFKKQGLNIIGVPLESGQESNRAISRNIRAKETQADWIIFADSDMVYEDSFFADLKEKLESDKYKDVKLVMGADRYSLDIPFSIKYFEEDKTIYPCVIEDVANKASVWPVYTISNGRRAAGYFQLVNVKALKEKGGVYCDNPRDVWRETYSDGRFRAKMGGRAKIETKKQYHLNHDRGDSSIQR